MEPTTLAVTAVEEPGFTVHLEPEGMAYEVTPGSGLLLRLGAAGRLRERGGVPGGGDSDQGRGDDVCSCAPGLVEPGYHRR